MYRSFITCDDPNGVVECGTIRKSKIVSHKMEDKVKSRRIEKNSSSSLEYKGKKEEMVAEGNNNIEDYHTASSFQLLQVCKGAQKLNHLIDSWSKGLSYDGQSKDVAKDLLKGALDLQESLTMLGKLQEASQYMAQWKRKQREKLERGRIDEEGIERMDTYRFGDHNQHMGLQNPSLSADGSSRDCIEELRTAIRDGLARQNMPSNIYRQGERNFNKRKMASISHMPSTCSSQLSANHSDNSHSTAGSSSQTALHRKNSPNLIAKLMGLEDIPSKAIMQSPQKRSDMEKNSCPRRPVFDIEMPRLRKPQSMVQKVDSDRRALKEILETVHFQGLLKGCSAKDFEHQSHQSSNLHYKQKLVGDISPIVLIKPMRVPRSESEEAPGSMVWEEAAWSLRKMKMKEGPAIRLMDEQRITSNSRKMNCRTVTDKLPVAGVMQEEGPKDLIEEFVIPEEKEVRMIDQKEGDKDVNRVNRKLKADKPPLKRHNHEEGTKDCKELVIRTGEKEVKKKLKNSSKIKASNPVNYQQQKKEKLDKKVDKVASSRKPVVKEIVKTENVSRSPDQVKFTSTRLSRPDTGSSATSNCVSQQCTSARKTVSKYMTQDTIHNSKNRKLKEKQAIEHQSTGPITDNLECNEDEKRIDLSYNNHSQKKESTTNVVDQPSTEEEASAFKVQTEEYFDDKQNSSHIATMPASEHGKDSNSRKENDDKLVQTRADSASFKTGNLLKDLLFSSPSFLNLAEAAFHLSTSHSKTSLTHGIHDWGDIDLKLHLDYANEYVKRRSEPDLKTRYISLYMGNSRSPISLKQLVEEVCSGVETLKSFHKLSGEELRTDSLYATTEKDMLCKGVVNGIWDSGWKCEWSLEEVDQTVNYLEKLLVNELMEEVFS